MLLGLAIGGGWTLLQPDRYAAETHMILSGPPAAELAPAVLTLANGSVVRENVRQTLRLARTPDLSASIDKGVLAITAEASNKERARQVDAEAGQVISQLLATRFGSQGLRASLLDPAHIAGQRSPTPGRNLLICGLLGLVAGGGLFAYRRSKHRPVVSLAGAAVDPELEQQLEQRIDGVTKREKGLARRAGELAEREARLEQRLNELERLEARSKRRDVELDQTKRQLAARADELAETERDWEARAAEPPLPPPPAPASERDVSPGPTPGGAHVSRPGSWNLNDLQRAVAAQTDATPGQAQEWATYLFFLREHAASDGSLPRQFEGLVQEVFGGLVP